MKKYYSLLGCVGLLAAGPVAPAAQGRVTLSGPAALCIGAGGLVATPSYLTVGPGATLPNKGQLDFGGALTNNGTVTAPTAGTSKALLRPFEELRIENGSAASAPLPSSWPTPAPLFNS